MWYRPKTNGPRKIKKSRVARFLSRGPHYVRCLCQWHSHCHSHFSSSLSFTFLIGFWAGYPTTHTTYGLRKTVRYSEVSTVGKFCRNIQIFSVVGSIKLCRHFQTKRVRRNIGYIQKRKTYKKTYQWKKSVIDSCFLARVLVPSMVVMMSSILCCSLLFSL